MCFIIARPVPMGGLAELKTIKFWIAVNAELLGTWFLVILGYRSAVEGATVVQIALASVSVLPR